MGSYYQDILYKKMHALLDECVEAQYMLVMAQEGLADARKDLAALDGLQEHAQRLEAVVTIMQKARLAKTEEEWQQANWDLDEALRDAGYYVPTPDQESTVAEFRNVFGEQRAKIADLERQINLWTERFRMLMDVLSKIAYDSNDGHPLGGTEAWEYKAMAREVLGKYAGGTVTAFVPDPGT